MSWKTALTDAGHRPLVSTASQNSGIPPPPRLVAGKTTVSAVLTAGTFVCRRYPAWRSRRTATREWISQCELVDDMRASIRREFPDLRDAQIERYLALLVLENTLGDQWVCEHIDRGGERRNPTDIYLLSRPSGTRERRENYVRVRELARRIFELAPEPFAERLNNNLRSRDLEGAAFEAEVARMLIALPVNLDMPEESGTRGGDYDIAVWLQPDRWIAVEIKTRSEHGSLQREGAESNP